MEIMFNQKLMCTTLWILFVHSVSRGSSICTVVINEINTDDPQKPENREFVELRAVCGEKEESPKLQGLMVLVVSSSRYSSATIEFTANLWNAKWSNYPYYVIGGYGVPGFARDLPFGDDFVRYRRKFTKDRLNYKDVFSNGNTRPHAFLLIRGDSAELKQWRLDTKQPFITLDSQKIASLKGQVLDMVVYARDADADRCSVFEEIYPGFVGISYVLRDYDKAYGVDKSINRCSLETDPFLPSKFKRGKPTPGKENDCTGAHFIFEQRFDEITDGFHATVEPSASSTAQCTSAIGRARHWETTSQLFHEFEDHEMSVAHNSSCPASSRSPNYGNNFQLLETLQERQLQWGANNEHEWETTTYFKQQWLKTMEKHQKTTMPFQKIANSKDIQSWFVYNYNGEDPTSSTYSCRLCSVYYDYLQLSVHEKPALASPLGTFHNTYQNNWKEIDGHYRSNAHITVKHHLIETFLQNVDENVADVRKSIERKNPELIITAKMFRTVYTEAQLNIPFDNHAEVVDLQVANGIDMGRHHRTRWSMKHMLELMSKEFHKRLVNYLSESKNPISVLMDSTTDMSRNHYLIVYFQTLEKNRPVIYFYKLIELGYDESAEGIFRAFISALEEDSLLPVIKNFLVGYAADGASTMMGPKNGVGKKLQEYLGRKLFIIHCMSHRLHLAIRHALKHLDFSSFEDDINSVYTFYSKGHKRAAHLKKVADEMQEHYYQLTYIHEIRWIASEFSSLKKVQSNWALLVEDLQQIQTSNDFTQDTKAKAMVLHEKLVSKEFVVKLNFLMDILRHLVYFSQVIQRKGSSVVGKDQIQHKLLETIGRLKTTLGENINMMLEQSKCTGTDPCSMSTFLFEHVAYKGVALTDSAFDFNSMREQTVRGMLEELESYFPEVELKAFRLFDPRNIPASDNDLKSYGKQEIYTLARFFNINGADVFNQWIAMLKTIKESNVGCLHQLSHPEIYWSNVLQASDVQLQPLIKNLIQAVLVLPIGSSECERGFSIMSHIRSSRRSRLTRTSLENSLRIRINGPRKVNEFNAMPYVLKWLYEGHIRTDDGRQPPGSSARLDDDDDAGGRFFAESTLF